MMPPESFDALIIGGGPSGAATAILLADAGWRAGLVEEGVFPRRKVCGEFLSPASLPLLGSLGLADDVMRLAGPPVRQVGLFAGESCVRAPMPRSLDPAFPYGCALGREQLDTLLLHRAAAAGTTVFQPYRATAIEKVGEWYCCCLRAAEGAGERVIRARVIVAAHGSWKPGSLITQPRRRAARASDLFGFKAHFRGDQMAPGLMPLLAYPGGYGGMVHTSGDRLSFSCCIRRDKLEEVRGVYSDRGAAYAVLAYIQTCCAGVREALAEAELEGKWLSVGPIQPGIRVRPMGGIFRVGNAGGEAHPAIAEGITLAIQSASILASVLIRRKDEVLAGGKTEGAAEEYARLWRRQFAGRIRVSSLVAFFAMHGCESPGLLRLIERFPGVLTWGARWSGKV